MDDWKYKPSKGLGHKSHDRHKDLERESGLHETIVRFLWWQTIRGYLSLFHRLKINGRKHLPEKPPFIIVANHSSHLDTMILGSMLPKRHRNRMFPLAAGDFFFEKPTVAAFAATFINALPIWRGNFSEMDFEILQKRLVEEKSIFIMFPEGTRSRDGVMARFRRGIGMFVTGTDVPVVPCYIRGAHDAFPHDRKFPKFVGLSLNIGVPLIFTKESNNEEGWERTASEVEKAVISLNVDF